MSGPEDFRLARQRERQRRYEASLRDGLALMRFDMELLEQTTQF
jgi:hypothetical protein